ncbi:hypothetical protein VTO42DRAFT_8038 [Malbranchea cinnamomea]
MTHLAHDVSLGSFLLPFFPELPPGALRSPTLSSLGEGITNATTAALSTLAVYPLALVATRFQVQRNRARHGNWRQKLSELHESKAMAREIYNAKNGLSGLYAGAVEASGKAAVDSLLRILVFAALNRLKSKPLEPRGAAASVSEQAAVGLLAELIIVSLTSPAGTVVTRKQVQGLSHGSNRQTTKAIVSQIYSEKGLKGFWAGYPASLFLSLNLPLTILLHKALNFVMYRSRKPNASVTYLLWILSHAIASSVTYPFSVIRSRQQAAVQDDNESSGLREVLQSEGHGALYSGITVELLRTLTSYAAGAFFKDLVHGTLYRTHYLLSLLFEHRIKVDSITIGIASKDASAWGSVNATAELVADYVEDEAQDWRGLYHWFWIPWRRGNDN